MQVRIWFTHVQRDVVRMLLRKRQQRSVWVQVVALGLGAVSQAREAETAAGEGIKERLHLKIEVLKHNMQLGMPVLLHDFEHPRGCTARKLHTRRHRMDLTNHHDGGCLKGLEISNLRRLCECSASQAEEGRAETATSREATNHPSREATNLFLDRCLTE